jgi:hypothetical protein
VAAAELGDAAAAGLPVAPGAPADPLQLSESTSAALNVVATTLAAKCSRTPVLLATVILRGR